MPKPRVTRQGIGVVKKERAHVIRVFGDFPYCFGCIAAKIPEIQQFNIKMACQKGDEALGKAILDDEKRGTGVFSVFGDAEPSGVFAEKVLIFVFLSVISTPSK